MRPCIHCGGTRGQLATEYGEYRHEDRFYCDEERRRRADSPQLELALGRAA